MLGEKGEFKEALYSLNIDSEKSLEILNFNDFLEELINGKKIVSFGESHDYGLDKSFEEVERYKEIIFDLYKQGKFGKEPLPQEVMSYYQLANPDLLLGLLKLINEFLNKNNFLNSSSRLFASKIIPKLKKQGFTDLIIEGFNEEDIEGTFRKIKDKTGFLLIILMASISGLKIHGISNDVHFLWPISKALNYTESFKEKIDSIMENEDAKVFTYNGGMHHYLNPIKGEYNERGNKIKLEDLTFGPYLAEKYGAEYLPVDLIDNFIKQEGVYNHYSFLSKNNQENDKLRVINYNKGQVAIVFPNKKGVDISDKVSDLIDNSN